MRIWHNFYPVGDIVQYMDDMYGVMHYPGEIDNHDIKNGKWLYTMLSHEDVQVYLDWCWRECDRLIYNAFERKPGDKEWLPGDELNEDSDED
jgi:hypothetical protein